MKASRLTDDQIADIILADPALSHAEVGALHGISDTYAGNIRKKRIKRAMRVARSLGMFPRVLAEREVWAGKRSHRTIVVPERVAGGHSRHAERV